MEFRKKLYNYYKTALDKCYDVDDPRTWKSVCMKCNHWQADNVLFLDFSSEVPFRIGMYGAYSGFC
jgi:hypothetical protein